MKVKQFISYYLEIGGVDFDGAYGKQCVDLFRAFHRDVLGRNKQPRGVVGAKDFWANYDTDSELKDNYTKIPNTADFVPIEGDVMVWKNGTYGHIAICTGDGDKNYFKSLDQNWTNNREINIVTHNYTNVFGVLRPKELDMSDEKIYTQAQYDEVRLARDANHVNWQEEIDEHDKTKRELMELQGRYNTLADEHDKCQPLGEPVLISPSVEVADATWDINGVQVDSNGLVTANYARKK